MTEPSRQPFPAIGRACAHTIEIPAYLAGELSSDDELRVRTHADGCAVCGPELASMRTLVDHLRAVTITEPDEEWELPHAVGAGLFARALEEPASASSGASGAAGAARPSQRRRRVLVSIAAASVAFAAGAGSVVGYQAAVKKDPPKGETVTLQLLSTKSSGSSGSSGAVDPSGSRPVRAWAWISQGPGGTYAVLYAKGLPAGQHYYMWFEKADGTRSSMGSFASTTDGTIWLKCPGSSALARNEIVAIGASTSKSDVLRADLRTGAAGKRTST